MLRRPEEAPERGWASGFPEEVVHKLRGGRCEEAGKRRGAGSGTQMEGTAGAKTQRWVP